MFSPEMIMKMLGIKPEQMAQAQEVGAQMCEAFKQAIITLNQVNNTLIQVEANQRLIMQHLNITIPVASGGLPAVTGNTDKLN